MIFLQFKIWPLYETYIPAKKTYLGHPWVFFDWDKLAVGKEKKTTLGALSLKSLIRTQEQ